MGKTPIEWSEHSINPLRARAPLVEGLGHYCEKVSPGCKNCYSSRMQPRFRMPQFQEQRRIDVETFLDPAKLEEVLRRKKPTTYFWCDMTDMFGDWVPNEVIAACFGVMAATPWHTHQVLTKRAERMREWFGWLTHKAAEHGSTEVGACATYASQQLGRSYTTFLPELTAEWPSWPLPNVWLGVSAEDQQRADERIVPLLQTPAAVRFLSAEPLLGPLDLWRIKNGAWHDREGADLYNALSGTAYWSNGDHGLGGGPRLDWVIAGGESGPRARPPDVEWFRSLRDHCREYDVAFFLKQLGRGVLASWKLGWDERLDSSMDLFSIDRIGVKGTNFATVCPNGRWHTWDADGTGGENGASASVEEAQRDAIAALVRQQVHPIKGWQRHRHMLKHPKGGDPSEWPEDLRVREMPRAQPMKAVSQ